MGFFSSNNTDNEVPTCALADALGEPALYLDGRGVNLFVYDKCIVIDKTKGGLWNSFNRTYKVIPLKYIIAIEMKSTGAMTGYIEFATVGNEDNQIRASVERKNENMVSYSSEASAKAANDIVKFILPRIL